MKIQYKTKNKELLLHYLKETAGRHVTVPEICAYFKSQGQPMGTATVYRQLERMVEEGSVNRYLLEGSSAAYFEYVDQSRCGEQSCYHCKCERCGRLIHLHCQELEELRQHIFAQHGFSLDPIRTVFYGVCDQCRE